MPAILYQPRAPLTLHLEADPSGVALRRAVLRVPRADIAATDAALASRVFEWAVEAELDGCLPATIATNANHGTLRVGSEELRLQSIEKRPGKETLWDFCEHPSFMDFIEPPRLELVATGGRGWQEAVAFLRAIHGDAFRIREWTVGMRALWYWRERQAVRAAQEQATAAFLLDPSPANADAMHAAETLTVTNITLDELRALCGDGSALTPARFTAEGGWYAGN